MIIYDWKRNSKTPKSQMGKFPTMLQIPAGCNKKSKINVSILYIYIAPLY